MIHKRVFPDRFEYKIDRDRTFISVAESYRNRDSMKGLERLLADFFAFLLGENVSLENARSFLLQLLNLICKSPDSVWRGVEIGIDHRFGVRKTTFLFFLGRRSSIESVKIDAPTRCPENEYMFESGGLVLWVLAWRDASFVRDSETPSFKEWSKSSGC